MIGFLPKYPLHPPTEGASASFFGDLRRRDSPKSSFVPANLLWVIQVGGRALCCKGVGRAVKDTKTISLSMGTGPGPHWVHDSSPSSSSSSWSSSWFLFRVPANGAIFSGLRQRLYFGVGCDFKDLEQPISLGGPDWAGPYIEE